MFESFPKVRPSVDGNALKKSVEYYKKNRLNKTPVSRLTKFMEGWMHKKIVKDSLSELNTNILEIGAGSLNHLAYENAKAYDIVEPWGELFVNSPFYNKVQTVYSDIKDIPCPIKYDRIISIATFEHLLNLPEVVANSCCRLGRQGVLQVGIPNEGSLLWKLCWRISTGFEYYLKTGGDYGVIMKYEHVNTANEIEKALNYFFEDVQKSLFGVSNSLCIYRVYKCKTPRVDLAVKYLKSLEK